MISATFKSALFKSFVSAFDLSTYIMHNIILRRISHKISTGQHDLVWEESTVTNLASVTQYNSENLDFVGLNFLFT
jgi:hypothetical protein